MTAGIIKTCMTVSFSHITTKKSSYGLLNGKWGEIRLMDLLIILTF